MSSLLELVVNQTDDYLSKMVLQRVPFGVEVVGALALMMAKYSKMDLQVNQVTDFGLIRESKGYFRA